ncbi:MAG: hypothetical protein AB7S36_17335 [Planctomycetota bacterium]
MTMATSMASAYQTVREVLSRGRRQRFAEYQRELIEHADVFRMVAGWMQKVKRLAATRPSLASRCMDVTPEFSRAMKIIESNENGCSFRLIECSAGEPIPA